MKITDAHLNSDLSKRTPLRKITKSKKLTPPPARSSPLSSVTSVLFQPNTWTLFSSGANDGAIKMWDLRRLSQTTLNISPSKCGLTNMPTPVKTIKYANKASHSTHGFTSLAFDNRYRVFASCSDHNIYCFDPMTCRKVAAFSGHSVNNFTKIRIIDDQLISGSTNRKL